jgi:DNA-binding NarL/FixJ family response regulator
MASPSVGGDNRAMSVSVLIVDDHAGFRRQARRLLESEGYRVIGEAEDLRTGVEAVGALEPDLVLVDIYLPDEDGFELTSRLLAADEPPDVILISSHEGAEFERCVPESGARGFVSKSELSRQAIEAVLR